MGLTAENDSRYLDKLRHLVKNAFASLKHSRIIAA